jgi:hypothetical protein
MTCRLFALSAISRKANAMSEFRFDKTVMRPGQLGAFNTTVGRIRDGKSTASNVLPTRYGKSDTQRLVQLQMHSEGLVVGTVQLTPSLYLVRQFCSDSEVLEMAARYSVPAVLAMKIRQAQPDDEWFSNGEYCVAMTVQMATQNSRIIVQNAMQWADMAGAPVHLCVDECDETVLGRSRGNLVEQWLKAGFPLSMWTALAVREDGERVPGFQYEETGREEGVRTESFPEIQQDGEIKRRVNTISGRRVQIRIKADHETTFRQAWDEHPSPLCRLNRLVVDVDLEDEEGNSIGKLSEQSESLGRSALGKATMNDAAISQGVRYLLHDMRQNRNADERCTGIVFTGNDRPEVSNEDNFHAKLVEKKIHELSAECGFKKKLRVVVATVKKEEKIADLLDEFVSGRGGDILVVKQAAGRGLTAPHLKTLLDLSSVRKARSYVQRIMRVSTPFDAIRTATVITLADKVGTELWKTYIQDQGGESDPDMVEFVDDELIRTKLVDIEESDEGSISVSGAELHMFDDSMGLFGSAAQYPLVAKIVEAIPESKSRRTLAEIAKALHDVGLDISQSDVLRTTSTAVGIGSEIKQLQDAVKATARAIVEQSIPYQGVRSENYEQYQDAHRAVYSAAKRAAGVPTHMRLESVTNVKTLKAMNAYMEARVHDSQVAK